MKLMKAISIFIFTCLLGMTANAGNLRFLDDTAVSNFNDQDLAMMQKNMNYALDHNKDGKKSLWKNPNTTASGYAVPVSTTKKDGSLCRKLTIMNEAKRIQGMSTFTFCRIKGEWKIVE